MKDVLSKKKERIGTHSSQSKNKAIGKKWVVSMIKSKNREKNTYLPMKGSVTPRFLSRKKSEEKKKKKVHRKSKANVRDGERERNKEFFVTH